MKNKKNIINIKLLLFIFAILNFQIVVKAEEVYSEGYFLYVINQDTVEIVNYFGTDDEVEIPEKIANMKVLKIREYTFANCVSVKKIELPESVKEIDVETFKGAINLEKIVIVDNKDVEKDVSDLYIIKNKESGENDEDETSINSEFTTIENNVNGDKKEYIKIGITNNNATESTYIVKKCEDDKINITRHSIVILVISILVVIILIIYYRKIRYIKN